MKALACPLTATDRQLIEEVVPRIFNDAVWVGDNAHGVDRGFALSLIGSDASHIGVVTRIGPCAQRESFVPYCERDFEQPIVRCSRLACEAAGVDTAAVSISGPRRSPLEYKSASLPGRVRYEPFPSVVWRTIEVEPDN